MNYKNFYSIALILSLLVIDIMSKQMSVIFLKDNNITIIKDIFQLKLAFNDGIAFSIPFKGNIMILFTIFILSFILYIRLNEYDAINIIAFDIILAGGIGNLLERIFYGYVVDFISILSFPIFNFADIYVVCGFLLYTYNSMFKTKNKKL